MKCNIGLKSYKIKFINKDVTVNNVLCYGANNEYNEIIEIDNRASSIQKKETLLHEIIHCINNYNAIGLKEKQVVSLSNNLLEALYNNSKVTKFLLGDFKQCK